MLHVYGLSLETRRTRTLSESDSGSEFESALPAKRIRCAAARSCALDSRTSVPLKEDAEEDEEDDDDASVVEATRPRPRPRPRIPCN